MRFFRKTLILIHRYLGIALSLLFLIWFVSGISMIYARGMPALSPESRLARLPVLDAQRIRLSPAEALAKAEVGGFPETVELTSVLGRPAYRLSGTTVFADNGETLDMNADRAAQAAGLFMGLPEDRLQAAGVLQQPDQWTITERSLLPLHKFTVADSDRTELYVSELTGDVVLLTTRGSRALAWIAAIPHWMYFEALRTRPRVWRLVVLWTSGLATMAASIGLVLAVLQYRRRRPHIPYTGWLRWHYLTGTVFGVVTVTWTLSGFLSMEPWFWASDGGLGDGMTEALRGGDLDLAKFPAAIPNVSNPKTVEFLMIQGQPYYGVRTTSINPVLVSAASMQLRTELFSTDSLVNRITEAAPGVPVLETTLLEDYDSYYYSFGRRAPLPVLRVKFNDADSSWIYVDPRMSRVVGRAHRRERLQRWIYHGFHSLDFPFWYYRRPAWDIGVIALSLGGISLSVIGAVIAWKRLTRGVFSKIRRDTGPSGH